MKRPKFTETLTKQTRDIIFSTGKTTGYGSPDLYRMTKPDMALMFGKPGNS